MFALNEKVVYPGYGVALIKQIMEKTIGAQKTFFYELHLLNKNMTILVPLQSVEVVGIRRLESEESVETLFKDLSEAARKAALGEFNLGNWNKRNKEYQLKLRTGRLKDLSDIYKDLYFISRSKELSFGEKTILKQTETLLAEEISIIWQKAEEKAIEKLRLVCSEKQQKTEQL
jgi:CarD family transcriptional regulator